jgi:hypothetical protein
MGRRLLSLDMKLSRRDALRIGGGALATVGLAGCVEQRVTRRETRVETSTTWALNPAVDTSLGADEFEAYTDRMAELYDESGVWGRESERAENFETAYVQRLGITRQTPAEPGGSESSLDPEEVDPDAPLLFADACVAVYRVGTNRYRYWLWIAADGNDSRLVRDVGVAILGLRLRFREGAVTDTAPVSTVGNEATVSIGGAPSGRFALNETTGAIESTSERGANGFYAVDWSGDVDGVQSINGLCEEERDGEYDVFWGIAAGYNFEEQV